MVSNTLSTMLEGADIPDEVTSKYDIIKLIGGEAEGEVYLALGKGEPQELSSCVALKVLKSGIETKAQEIQQLKTASVTTEDDRLIRILDVSDLQENTADWYTTNFLSGCNLHQMLHGLGCPNTYSTLPLFFTFCRMWDRGQ